MSMEQGARSMETGAKRLVFEQQAREGNKAFHAFRVYLGLGPERSLMATAGKLGRHVRLVEKWSRKFDWPARVAAHGAHLALVERQAAEAVAVRNGEEWARRVEAHREDEWKVRTELMDAGLKVLAKFRDGSRGATLGDVARALDIASKLGRLATGMGTDGERHQSEELPAVRVEVSLALERVYGQPLPGEVVEVEEIGKAESRKQKLEIGNGEAGV